MADLEGFAGCIGDETNSAFTCLEDNFVLGAGVSTLGRCIIDDDLCGEKFDFQELAACTMEDGADIFACVSNNVVLGSAVETLGACLVDEGKCADKINLDDGAECTEACAKDDAGCILSCGMSAVGFAPGVSTLAGCLVDEDKCASNLELTNLVSCLQDPAQYPISCIDDALGGSVRDVMSCDSMVNPLVAGAGEKEMDSGSASLSSGALAGFITVGVAVAGVAALAAVVVKMRKAGASKTQDAGSATLSLEGAPSYGTEVAYAL
jgi:hypothetical protein